MDSHSMPIQTVMLEEFLEPLEVQDVDRPGPESYGVVAEVEGCGVCRSDWHCWQGDRDWSGYRHDPPHVLGYEPAETMVEFVGRFGVQPSRYPGMIDVIDASKLDPVGTPVCTDFSS